MNQSNRYTFRWGVSYCANSPFGSSRLVRPSCHRSPLIMIPNALPVPALEVWSAVPLQAAFLVGVVTTVIPPSTFPLPPNTPPVSALELPSTVSGSAVAFVGSVCTLLYSVALPCASPFVRAFEVASTVLLVAVIGLVGTIISTSFFTTTHPVSLNTLPLSTSESGDFRSGIASPHPCVVVLVVEREAQQVSTWSGVRRRWGRRSGGCRSRGLSAALGKD